MASVDTPAPSIHQFPVRRGGERESGLTAIGVLPARGGVYGSVVSYLRDGTGAPRDGIVERQLGSRWSCQCVRHECESEEWEEAGAEERRHEGRRVWGKRKGRGSSTWIVWNIRLWDLEGWEDGTIGLQAYMTGVTMRERKVGYEEASPRRSIVQRPLASSCGQREP
jgi:hypothetical protein